MEAVVAQYAAEHHRQSLSVSPYKNKQIRSPRNRSHHSVNLAAAPRVLPHESFSPIGGGVGGGWPVANQSFGNSQKQPPLLPLPATPKSHVSSYPPPPPNSANPKPQRLARHGSPNPTNKPLIRRQGSMVVPGRGGSGPLGPHPNELPRDISISKVPNFSVKPAPLGSGRLLDSVFELAPPPSSLPLPKFSLRPKLGCNAEAGVDSGATDGLRRILRLP